MKRQLWHRGHHHDNHNRRHRVQQATGRRQGRHLLRHSDRYSRHIATKRLLLLSPHHSLNNTAQQAVELGRASEQLSCSS